MKSKFDYESKIFGLGQIKIQPWYIPAPKIIQALASLKKTKGRILEVGAGGGAMSKTIASQRKDLKVYASDISKKAISLAKKDPAGVVFRMGDVYKLPYQNKFFDAVICFDVFEHLDYIETALSEINRVLKKGGVLHIAIPLEGDLRNIEGWLTHLGWRAKEIYCGHVSNFKVGDLEKLASKNGFKLTKRIFSNHLLYQIADALYFSFIYIRGKNIPYQVEGLIEAGGNGLNNKILAILKSIFATVTFYESKLLFWFPALTNHLTFKKK